MSEPGHAEVPETPNQPPLHPPERGAGLAERIVERHGAIDLDGASNSSLERVSLDDGTPLVLKRFDSVRDLGMAVAGRTVPLDVELWQSGVLEQLPPTLGHAVRGAWLEDGAWVLAMSDLTGRLLTSESQLSREQYRIAIWAVTIMHGACSTIPLPALLPLEKRIGLFAPGVMSNHLDVDNPLPRRCLQGWEAWDDLAPRDVKDAIARIHADPSLLTTPLSRLGPVTLLHGDFRTSNLAIDRNRVIAIDWGLATVGPPVLEFASFLVRCSTQVRATHDELLDDLRALDRDAHNEDLLLLGLVFGVVEMGWRLAYDVALHPLPAARDEFDWWIEAARDGLATGLIG
jgi:hypothetical protein